MCRVWWQFPWLENFPLLPRLGILAAYTALGIIVIIATLQRLLIRLLLRYKGFLYNSRRPTLALKLWVVAMRFLISRRPPGTYSFQGVLPSLPLPPLKDTCERYLRSVKSLQTPEQFARTQVGVVCVCVFVCPCVCVCRRRAAWFDAD
jgi:carnitine O-palmitoyltransferase 1